MGLQQNGFFKNVSSDFNIKKEIADKWLTCLRFYYEIEGKMKKRFVVYSYIIPKRC